MNEIEKFQADVAENIAKQGDKALWDLSRRWVIETAATKYSYNYTALGRPLIQFPQDMVGIQEIIWQTKPDLIIEAGIAHGGSLIWNAAMLALVDMCEAIENKEVLDPAKPRRRVLGLDIDIREHNKAAILAHPMANRIDMIEGSSIDKSTIDKVHAYAKDYQRIMVILDSNHTHAHVLAELEAYAPLTAKGCYCVVFDTIVEDVPAELHADRPWGPGDNPKTAVWAYLKSLEGQQNIGFEIDKTVENKLLITVAPDGFLKRVR